MALNADAPLLKYVLEPVKTLTDLYAWANYNAYVWPVAVSIFENNAWLPAVSVTLIGVANFVMASLATYMNSTAITALALREILSPSAFGLPLHDILDIIILFTQRSR